MIIDGHYAFYRHAFYWEEQETVNLKPCSPPDVSYSLHSLGVI